MNKYVKSLIFLLAFYISFFAHAAQPVIEYNDDNYKIISNLYTDSDFEFNLLKNMDVRNLKIPKCETIGLDLALCKQAICKVNAKFGDVIYKIKGRDEHGNCMFIERTTGLGGMNCALKSHELSDVQLDLIERIRQLKGEKVDSKFTSLKSLYARCNIVEDYKLTSEVQINFDYNAELDPEFNIDNFSDVKVVSVIDNLSTSKNSDSKKIRDNTAEYRSMFF